MQQLSWFICTLLLSVVFAIPVAHGAGQPEDFFQGSLFVSEQPFPTASKSTNSYIAAIRKQSASSVTCDKKSGSCRLYLIAFFAQPAVGAKVDLVMYDITSGSAKKLSQEQYLDKRGERKLSASLNLDNRNTPVNRQYLLTVESSGRIIAKGQVTLRGEEKKYSGKVEFSEEGGSK